AGAARELRRRRGISFDVLGESELRQIEPTLSADHFKAVYFPDARHVPDPAALTRHLADQFVREGGEVRIADVDSIDVGRGGRPVAAVGRRRCTFEQLVIAAGAWSKKLARGVGAFVPLDTERGYHAMLPSPNVAVRVPMIFGDHGIAVTPM